MTNAGLIEEEKQALRSKDMKKISQLLSKAGISVEGPTEGPHGGSEEMPIPITLTFDTSWIVNNIQFPHF